MKLSWIEVNHALVRSDLSATLVTMVKQSQSSKILAMVEPYAHPNLAISDEVDSSCSTPYVTPHPALAVALVANTSACRPTSTGSLHLWPLQVWFETFACSPPLVPHLLN